MLNDEYDISADDILEQARSNPLMGDLLIQPLPEDNDPPAASANSPYISPLPKDHPIFDSPNDSSEVYEDTPEQL